MPSTRANVSRMTLRLRPHHVLCSVGFEGVGYDDAFTANMSNLVRGQLRAPGGQDMNILISGHADAICAPCPKRRGLGCASQDRIDRFDADHAELLDLAPGQLLTWGECLEKVRENVVPDDLDRICRDCPWLPGGMCKAAVARLIQ
ncbi:hypothetical protein JAN5088_03005 [Jannaschia rubra]|uniref:DUF1284 domain-containing protein n=3 Tax=Jannaschia rubra TaxID=282197 RepID=A0A0M6XU05_9RHOB|nr:hypothetical protein JAN5088_03005 [Jannaschia rubra]SFG20500.1 hypothetical protein SAMN04488517_103132 [Jannaschia rubra]